MNSLKHTPKKEDACVAMSSCAPKESYPEAYLNKEQAVVLFGKDVPEAGEVYETEVQFRLKSVNTDNDGNLESASICLLSADPVEGASESDDYVEA